MAYNTNLRTKTIRGLVNSGADLMKNMYDIRIYFPDTSGKPSAEPFSGYPITVRASSFKIPDVTVGTYEIKYHGISIKRPQTEIQMDRFFDITFREDAAFNLRKRFTAWHAAVVDPVNGGVSNAAQFFGKIEVATISGAYFAPTTANTIFKEGSGELTTASEFNGLAGWAFYNVWVEKVTGADFSTADPGTIDLAVTFNFMDYDAPQYAENPLDVDLKWER